MKYKVVRYHSGTVVYRQVEYIDANSEEEAEELAYEKDLRFDDVVEEVIENIEVRSIEKYVD